MRSTKNVSGETETKLLEVCLDEVHLQSSSPRRKQRKPVKTLGVDQAAEFGDARIAYFLQFLEQNSRKFHIWLLQSSYKGKS